MCRYKFGMPARTDKMGTITLSRAKLISAEVANEAAQAVFLQQDWEGYGALFCRAFKDEMLTIFRNRYSTYGVRVK